MHLTKIAFFIVATSTTNALSLVEASEILSQYASASIQIIRRGISALNERDKAPSCPAVWTSIVSDLRTMFLDTSVNPSQCNDDARAAIRAAFHDCGTWDNTQGTTGGCDGSLIVAGEAFNRPENGGLQDISRKLLAMQQNKYQSVSVADLIQIASSVAITTCPGGPVVTTYVGRKDNSSAAGNPGGNLPDVHASAASLYALFQAKGFSAAELAALLGAHSTSKALTQSDIPVNGPQDSTPGVWDVKYYGETLAAPAGVYPFQSDINLAKHPVVGKEFSGLVNNQGKWTGAFATAMTKMSLLGVPGGNDPKKDLIDCTGVIPKSTAIKREIKAAPINDRIR